MRQVGFQGWVLVVTLLVGVAGAWTLWDAVSQYVNTLRIYAGVSVAYQQGSFTWLDPQAKSGRATLLVTNDSPRDARVEALDVHLRFGDDFAGSNYTGFKPFTLPHGESRTIDVVFLVTVSGGPARATTAELHMDGTLVVRFTGIRRARTLDVLGDIGVVPLGGHAARRGRI